MPRAPNRHTIMSHGGKHGDGSTYLKGTTISPVHAPHVPKNLTHEAAAPGAHLPPPAAPALPAPAPQPPPTG